MFPSSSLLEGNTSTRELTGRCVCNRSGSLRERSVPIALEPATSKGFSRPSKLGLASRDAGEQRREKTGRPIARATGREDKRSASKREATSCRDLERGAARCNASRRRNGCRAHEHGTSPRVSRRRAKVSSAEETRAFHEARCAIRSRSTSNGPPASARGALDVDDGKPEAVRHTRDASTEARTVT